jgi:photosystem II stability/assembly factor-like uncharacterized protein
MSKTPVSGSRFLALSCVCLTALLSSPFTTGTAFAEWESSGPFGGEAEVIRVVPKVPGFVIAATHNGLLFTSTNGGAYWTNLPFEAQFSGTLHALEIDPRFTGTWYAGMDSEHAWLSGVYKTVDAGKTWTLLPGTKGKAVWSLAIWSTNPDVVVAGTADGVYRSSDAGKNWAHISPPGDPELRPVVSLAFDPEIQDIIYAGTTHLPWRTANGGRTWESIHTGMLDDSDVFSIQVDRHNRDQVYASACSGLYHSSDEATHWNKIDTPKGAFRTWFVALDPDHSSTIFAGTTAGLMRSEDAGHVWHPVTSQAVRSMAFDPSVPGRIFFASASAGLMVSTDEGRTLREINVGFTNRSFTVLTGARGVLYTNSVFEPGSGGLYRTDNYGIRWQRSADHEGADIRFLTADPDRPQEIVAAGYHGLLKSMDSGKTWTERSSPPEGEGGVTALLALPQKVLLAGTRQGLFRSTNGGGWEAVAGVTGGVNSLARSGKNMVSVLGPSGAFASADSGETWRACGQPMASTVWYGLAFDLPASGTPVALAATAGGLFRSTDGCRSWGRAPGLPAETVSIVLFHPTRAGEAFATLGGRVLHSHDSGEHWLAMADEGRGRSWPSELLILPEAPERLFALFPRRGVLSNTILSNAIAVEAGSAPERRELSVRGSR